MTAAAENATASKGRAYLPHPCPVCGELIARDADRGHHPETYEWCHDECLVGLDAATVDELQQEGRLP